MSEIPKKKKDKEIQIDLTFNVSIRLKQVDLNRSRESSPANVRVTTPQWNVSMYDPVEHEYDLFKLGREFFKHKNNSRSDPVPLLNFYRDQMKWMNDTSGEMIKADKKNSVEWYQAVRGRIIEKLVHSAAVTTARHNNTLLVSKIVGYGAVTRSVTIREHTDIKTQVLEQLRNDWNMPGEVLEPCGLYMLAQFPVFAATTDAISKSFVYKVLVADCAETFNRLSAGRFTESELHEFNFVMHMTGRKKIYLIVTHYKYPVNKTLNKVGLEYDADSASTLFDDAQAFWSSEIFPLILQG